MFKKYGLDKQSEFVLDFGCGAGAVTNYFASKFESINFLGIDVNSDYVSIAKQKKEQNSNFQVFDLYKDLETLKNYKVDGIFTFQTLSWLENYDKFIEMLSFTSPQYAIVTSLFFEGMVDARIVISDFSRKMGDIDHRKTNYNIYSISRLNERLKGVGYFVDKALPFEIEVDLPKPKHSGMTTYTVLTDEKRRIQISGPILMSWYTLIIRKH